LRVDFSIVVRSVEGALGIFLDPEVFGRLKVVPEDRDDLLNLLI
jgi:hypothetical protein